MATFSASWVTGRGGIVDLAVHILRRVSILCLGEAIVDLVCERELDSPAEANSFTPHFGGALANVAVATRRAGAPAALAGGVGDDPWGLWLRDWLADEGVDLRWLSLVGDAATPIALITFDRDREPVFQVYGEGIAETLCSVEPKLASALEAADALAFGSNTLVGEQERKLTLRARELALERDIPVLFDPNLRPHRWDDLERARELCLSVCEGAFCVRANREEASWLAGTAAGDPAAAAEAISARGSRLSVVTLGADGALARGQSAAHQPGVPIDVASPLGAGDAFMGTLIAGLWRHGWDSASIATALADAVAASARACTVWRAVP